MIVTAHRARAVDHKLTCIVQCPGQVIPLHPAGAGVDNGGFRAGRGTQAEKNAQTKQQDHRKTQCFHYLPPKIPFMG